MNIFDLSPKNEARPQELDQFLQLIDEDALIRKKKVFRDSNFDKINKWYKAIRFLKSPNQGKPKATQGIIRLQSSDFHRFNKILKQDLDFLATTGLFNYSLSIQVETTPINRRMTQPGMLQHLNDNSRFSVQQSNQRNVFLSEVDEKVQRDGASVAC